MSTERVTVAQALVRFLAAQHVERDGGRQRFFAGCFGIFGHGNVAGLGQALQQHHDLLPYHQARNEQAMVHLAAGYARQRNRLGDVRVHVVGRPRGDEHGHRRRARDDQPAARAAAARRHVRRRARRTRCCSSSRRRTTRTVSVNDCFRPVSRYFDRIDAARAARRRGARRDARADRPGRDRRGHLALPEDVQTEVVEVPDAFLESARGRSTAARPRPRRSRAPPRWSARRARPLIVAGGGVDLRRGDGRAARVRRGDRHPRRARRRPAAARCRPTHPAALGAIGATGTPAANRLAREADVVIGVGTRWSDFTTASKSAFQDPGVRFVNVNVAALRRRQARGLAARGRRAAGARRAARGARRPARRRGLGAARGGRGRGVGEEVARLYAAAPRRRCPRQAEVIGAVNDAAGERGRRRLRRRLDARRPAQAVARARPRRQGLPRRVRLLVHGLRDPRRRWA